MTLFWPNNIFSPLLVDCIPLLWVFVYVCMYMFVMYVQEHWGSMMNLLVQCSTGKFRGKSQTLGERKRVLDFKRGNHFLNFYSSFRYGYQFFFFWIGNTRTIITYQKKIRELLLMRKKKDKYKLFMMMNSKKQIKQTTKQKRGRSER